MIFLQAGAVRHDTTLQQIGSEAGTKHKQLDTIDFEKAPRAFVFTWGAALKEARCDFTNAEACF